MLKTTTTKLCALAAAGALLSLPATAADDHRWELTGTAGQYFFDSDRDTDDATIFNLGVGYVLDNSWTLEAMIADFETELDNVDLDVDGRQYRLDALYHLSKWGDWQPYVVSGVGDMKLDPENFSSHRETLVNLGLGVKYLLSPRWQLRGDGRIFHSLDEEDTDYGINVGLSYLFGAAPAPAVPAERDSDGDGVLDRADACPGTPAGVAVNARGCPLDSDGDGVYDYQDNCPDTAANLKVDSKGCPQVLTETVSIELAVNFDTNSAVVKPQYFVEIKRVADFMAQYANTRVTVEGHTDDRGAAAYNQGLSQRRADAVSTVLVEQYGVSASRVEAIGYGEARPVADNTTREGRLANRRVVAQIRSDIEKPLTK